MQDKANASVQIPYVLKYMPRNIITIETQKHVLYLKSFQGVQ